MNGPESKTVFERSLAGIRRRWRLRRVLEGTALALAAVLLGGLAAIAIMDGALFDAGVVSAARGGFYLLAGVALLLLIAPPALRRAPDAAMARYVESRAPELDALMLSAVEARAALEAEAAPDGASPALARRLIGRAASGASPVVSGLERTRTRRAAAAAAGVLALGAALVILGPDGWRHGAWLLVHAAQDPAAAANPYAIRVAPGDVSILSGDDVHIAATPDGFRPDGLVLVSRREGEEAWTRTPLAPSPDSPVFETYLFDVTASMEYRVEHPVLSSPGHRIEVIPRPVAERIDLLYEFPEYTGRAPELISGGGDIAAVRGTRVEVRVTPSAPTQGGRLVLDGERSLPLRAGEDGDLRARIEVTDNGRYRVELEAGGYGMAPASPEHAIVAYVDTRPTVELLSPGRDARVTSIEEIAVEARAQDDVAVRDLELVLSVNGGPDEIVRLGEDSGPRATVAGRHELFLEERDLAPGDLIAYYVRARDAAGDPERQVSSDIYFMDVRPFEMSFRRAGGGGGGGRGRAGAQADATLSAQQRSLVVALFKLLRDRSGMDDAVFAERVETLGTAQTRIRDRVDAIVRRLGARSIIARNPGYRRMAEELPKASKSMLEVEAMLAVSDVENALPAARQALLHLQRADSAFREAQVAQGRQSGGGGGSAENDLANLFRLEMDRFRSPYEDVRRGDWTPPEQQLDEALRKLRELAERQQRALEQAGLRGQGTDGERQRALAEELEKLVRELERLTRRRSSESLRDSVNELERAARAMRRSADGADASAGAEALERLREARRLLDAEGPGRLARETQEALRRAEGMAEEQAGIERDLARTPGETDGETGDARQLAERKQALAGEVEAMESRLDRLAERAGRERQADAADALERAAGALREDQIAQRIRRSGERIAREGTGGRPEEEAAISRSLRGLRDRIASAARRIGASELEGARLSRLHDELRGTMRGLERDQERLADRARRRPALPGGGSRADVDRADLADARRALEQRVGGIGGLAEALARAPGLAGDLETLLAAIQAARRESDADAAALAQRHAELLAALQSIERELRARLDADPPAAWGSARTEPPPGQREIVDTYYRNLSERTSP
ncbi:MAG: hypothetical protein GWN84_05475 [Gammaproteobacteria bacterium]|nr:hypothetical protein [Gammaproteobacteria bacterium]NIR82417.1 hypothetical protein [Gammaproteobacteria bacterium]NIR91998.1 hypothetical protein [Gammaproteobacteria bacterium]NIU03554.1 hypothetical protein [Gammaproteobacteria bacterium]NIX84828.1 hypothetical protein [Gammaproteobacteria bacterium]